MIIAEEFKNVFNCFSQYETVKVVKINDSRVKMTYIIVLLAVFIVCVGNLLRSNRYCEFVLLESKDYNHYYYWNSAEWYDKVHSSSDQDFAYCNGTIDTNYLWSNEFKYVNNMCRFDLETRHVGSKRTDGLAATTSMGFFNGSHQEAVFIVPEVDVLSFAYSVSVDIQGNNGHRIQETPDVWMKLPRGDYEESPRNDNPTKLVTLRVGEILRLAGFTMDSRNAGPREDVNETVEPMYEEAANSHPIYRLTGKEIKFTVEISNHEFSEQFLDSKTRTRISVETSEDPNTVQWSCTGWKMIDYPPNSKSVINGYSCDVRVLMSVSGSFCFFSWSMCIYALVELAVFFSVASLIVDAFFSSCMKKFRYAKSSTDLDELISKRQAQKADSKGGHQTADQWVRKLEMQDFETTRTAPEPHHTHDIHSSSTFYLDDEIEEIRPEKPGSLYPPSSLSPAETPSKDFELRGGELTMRYAENPKKRIAVKIHGLTSREGMKYNGRKATIDSAKMKNKLNDRWMVQVDDEYVQVRKENLTVMDQDSKGKRILTEPPLN